MTNSLFQAKYKNLGSENIHIKGKPRGKRSGNNNNFRKGMHGPEFDKMMEFNTISAPSHSGSVVMHSGNVGYNKNAHIKGYDFPNLSSQGMIKEMKGLEDEEDEEDEFFKYRSTHTDTQVKGTSDEINNKRSHTPKKELNLSFQDKQFQISDFNKKKPSKQDLSDFGAFPDFEKLKKKKSNQKTMKREGAHSVLTARTNDMGRSNKFRFEQFDLNQYKDDDEQTVPKPNSIRNRKSTRLNLSRVSLNKDSAQGNLSVNSNRRITMEKSRKDWKKTSMKGKKSGREIGGNHRI